MGHRRKARELALQTLYLVDVAHLKSEIAFANLIRGEEPDPKIFEFAKQLADGALAQKTQLDEIICKYAQNWEMNRMAAIDRNILRLGTYEIIYELDTPVSVVINEAVEIAKTYSTEDSGKFANGILDKVKLERAATSSDGRNGT